MRTKNQFSFVHGPVIAGLLIQGACGGGGSEAPASTVQPGSVSVGLVGVPSDVISRDSASVTAQVQGSANTAVTWTVDGIQNGNSTVGTISGRGTP